MRFRDQIADAIDQGLYPIQWLDAQVYAGFVKVWSADDACCLTEIRTFPSGLFEVHYMVAAGNKETMVNVIAPQVEQWAREIGAIFTSIASRKGWERVMKPHGYEVQRIELRKKLWD